MGEKKEKWVFVDCKQMGNSGNQMVEDHKYSFSQMKNIKMKLNYCFLLSHNKHFIQLTSNVDFVHGTKG